MVLWNLIKMTLFLEIAAFVREVPVRVETADGHLNSEFAGGQTGALQTFLYPWLQVYAAQS